MVSALISESSCLGFSPVVSLCVVFLGKTLYYMTHNASLHPGVLMATGKHNAGGGGGGKATLLWTSIPFREYSYSPHVIETLRWRLGRKPHAPLQSLLEGLKVILIRTYPTASQSPEGQYPKEKICDVKSCCCSCLPSLRSHDLTVLSKPPVSKQSISNVHVMFN